MAKPKPKTKTKKAAPKRKSKGKRHPVHARSLDRMAEDAEQMSQYNVAKIFRQEAKRLRSIVR